MKKDQIKTTKTITSASEIVQPISFQIDDLLKELEAKWKMTEHTNEYLTVLERDDIQTPHIDRVDVEFAMMLKAQGFNLFVAREKVVPLFKYAAVLWDIFDNSSVSNQSIHEYKKRRTNYLYIGDIPDFALDRIKTAKKVRAQRIGANSVSLTIHSNAPLPVEYIEARYHDPVVIAWNNHPAIIASENKCTLDDWQRDPQILGCVIAMWGEDGQPL